MIAGTDNSLGNSLAGSGCLAGASQGCLALTPCGQASELGVAEEWYARTVLEDISGIAPELINDDRLYRGLDHLGRRKDRLCEHLMQRYRDWFGVRFEFLLYDVTSTYFEGQALGNKKAARGYNRDKRSDCKQVCIGLVFTPEGLPLNYEVFDGNRENALPERIACPQHPNLRLLRDHADLGLFAAGFHRGCHPSLSTAR